MTSLQATDLSPRHAVEVVAPARLHLGMLSFGTPEVRSFGGVGVMIDRPSVRLRLEAAERITASGPLADRVEGFARGCARAWGLDRAGCRIEVVESPASHAGLGSGTQLALGVAAGMRRLFRLGAGSLAAAGGPDASDSTGRSAEEAVSLARVVGRGRRSSVGVYGFAGGGLILEGGRSVAVGAGDEDDATRPFSPLLVRVYLPAAWRCVLFLLRDSSSLHGEAERQAFRTLPPVPLGLTAELARIAVTELVPAAVEGRFEPFAAAVHRYGRLAGEPFAPVSATLPHAAVTARLFSCLETLAVAGTAQSSWGPTVTACCPSAEAAAEVVERFAATDLASRYATLVVGYDRRGAVVRDLPATDR